MKQHVLQKEFFKEIHKSRNRFLSILLIVFLGVAFFTGLRATGPDMRYSADRYFDRAALLDIRIVSTLGLTMDDVNAIAGIDGVDTVVPGYTADVLTSINKVQYALHFMSSPTELNQITVVNGRMPQTANECLVDTNFFEKTGYQIGDTFSVTSGTDDSIDTILNQSVYTIVGEGNSPYYLSLERGTTSIGDGMISSFVIAPAASFASEAYTEVNIGINHAKDLLCYSDAYTDLVEQVSDRLKMISDGRCQLRYAEVQADGQKKINDASQKIDDAKQELSDAQQKILDAQTEIADGEKELADKKQELSDAQAEINTQEQTLTDGWAQYQDGVDELNSRWQEYNDGVDAYQDGINQLNEQIEQLNQSQNQLTMAQGLMTPEQIQTAQAQIDAGRIQVQAAKQQLEATEIQLSDAYGQLTQAQETLDSTQAQLSDGQEQLDSAKKEISDGETQIQDAEQKLSEAKDKLADGQREYNEKAGDANEEITDGETSVEDAQESLDSLEIPEWYVLDRQTIQTYVEYGQNADRIVAIGNVFPMIFFIVAMLICLTTMTRMVEEQRIQIGTLKAMGYGNGVIAAKYLGYAFLACLVGSVAGLILGQKLLPVVIIRAYAILYNNLPDIVNPLYLSYSLIGIGLAIGCILVATLFACYRETVMLPAKLMRPESPKVGKRIFLERISILWRHFSFSYKAAFRNLLRYKKRLFMTVFGIGACMGLLLVGFGIKDSIMAIGEIQFSEIRQYDAVVMYRDDATEQELTQLWQTIDQDHNVTGYMRAYEKTIDVETNGTVKSAYIMVPESSDDMQNYISMHDRVTKKSYTLDDQGIVITEKLAKLLDVREGDTVQLKDGDTSSVDVKIEHVAENYYFHYVYMSPLLYKQLYDSEPTFMEAYVEFKQDDKSQEDAFRGKIMALPAASAVTFLSALEDRIADMLTSMDAIIYVLVVSAGLLAFVVLYNLNNINISERRRELATLKVLGFYDGEVSAYVFRENIWLTIAGAFVGIIFGILLHQYVILTAEIDVMMFGRDIKLMSYIYSILLTFFSLRLSTSLCIAN